MSYFYYTIVVYHTNAEFPDLSDSKRSDGCIDFKIMLVFFPSVITFWGSKNVFIFYFSIFSNRKVNLFDTLRGQK